MKNTHLIIISAMLAASVAGCTENAGTETPADTIARATVSISGGAATKSTSITAADEEAVSNLQLFVFDENGNKEFYLNAGASAKGEIITKEGKKTIVAVVNAPELGNIGNRGALLNTTTLLSDNGPKHMVMTGEVETVLQDGGHITIPVTRIISKVMIRKVTSRFTSSTNAEKEFRIKSIYLINVAGDNTLAATSEPTIWYNKLTEGYNDTECQSFQLLSDSVNKSVSANTSYVKDHSFYCYPNLITNESFSSTWSPRHTMLVVDATLGTDHVYYPVELPVIGRNKAIIIEELIITKKGSDNPYEPVRDGSCETSIQVVPWDVIFDNTETI